MKKRANLITPPAYFLEVLSSAEGTRIAIQIYVSAFNSYIENALAESHENREPVDNAQLSKTMLVYRVYFNLIVDRFYCHTGSNLFNPADEALFLVNGNDSLFATIKIINNVWDVYLRNYQDFNPVYDDKHLAESTGVRDALIEFTCSMFLSF